MEELPLIFVTVGTDHHPFDRLVRWIDRWAQGPGRGRARVVVQWGTSTPPRAVEGKPYVSQEEMTHLIGSAAAVVCHGGPGTISAVRRGGSTPVVVARQAANGEHVDDHQSAFVAHLADEGEVIAPRSEEGLHAILDRVLRDPSLLSSPAAADAEIGGTVANVERLVEAEIGARRQADPVRVLYIGGVGRSGTTLLDRMLGELPGVCSVGELVHVWLRGLKENDLCGCGRHFLDCPFWTDVGKLAFGGWEKLDPQRMLELKQAVDRHRYLPLMLAPWVSPRYRRDSEAYARRLTPLYLAIREASGASVIVDSSKHAPYAFILRSLPGISLRVVQMVRRSQGVAYSWTKRVRRPEVTVHESYMATYLPSRMAARWTLFNLLFEGLDRMGTPMLRVRYEDLVRDPEPTLRGILDFAEHPVPEGSLGFIQGDSLELGEGHNPSGNPMRFQQGRLPLRLDEEWRRMMPPRDQATVQRITAPLLRRYGYLD